jgi:hypothetical protein
MFFGGWLKFFSEEEKENTMFWPGRSLIVAPFCLPRSPTRPNFDSSMPEMYRHIGNLQIVLL